jgi:hypothetical protein
MVKKKTKSVAVTLEDIEKTCKTCKIAQDLSKQAETNQMAAAVVVGMKCAVCAHFPGPKDVSQTMVNVFGMKIGDYWEPIEGD